MAVHTANVDRWFKTRHGISCKQEWLEACLYWISQEEASVSIIYIIMTAIVTRETEYH